MKNNGRFVAGWTAVSIVAQSVSAAVALLAAAVSWAGILPVIALEACLLGLGQRWLLRRESPGLEHGWVAATVAGTLLGRCAQFGADSGPGATLVSAWPVGVQVALGAALGLIVGALMAAPQAFVLSHRIPHAWRWMGVRAAAWGIALPSLMLAGAWVADASATGPGTLALAIFVTFALVGAAVGLVEGLGFARLTRPATANPAAAPLPGSAKPSIDFEGMSAQPE